jgi:hypothetical protein
MSNKQTSIEWLRQELHSFIMGNSKLGYDEIIEQAKFLHKNEIVSFTENYIEDYADADYNGHVFMRRPIEEVYQETFVSKGSDDLPKEENKTSYGEISDEEIEKGAWEYVKKHKINGGNVVHWNNAIKWYREQLKQL